MFTYKHLRLKASIYVKKACIECTRSSTNVLMSDKKEQDISEWNDFIMAQRMDLLCYQHRVRTLSQIAYFRDSKWICFLANWWFPVQRKWLLVVSTYCRINTLTLLNVGVLNSCSVNLGKRLSQRPFCSRYWATLGSKHSDSQVIIQKETKTYDDISLGGDNSKTR